jgi:HlyD family secretion protein
VKIPLFAALCAAVLLPGCAREPVSVHAAPKDTPSRIIVVKTGQVRRRIRATGVVQAVRAHTVMAPQISGQGGQLTLTHLIPNGATVKAGDRLAEFDRTQQVEAAREAKAKYEDLQHQLEQKRAEHENEAEKRRAALLQAQSDLAKAEIQIRKGPILSEIDHLKNQAKLEDARAHVASLEKSNRFHDTAEVSAMRILELQRDRQKVGLERALRNSELLELKAPLEGMVALDTIWRNGTMGRAQEGDTLWPGHPILRIFDPSLMEVVAAIGEPDGANLLPDARAQVRLDAYPDLLFNARFGSASPVATSAVGSQIRVFSARFRLEQGDPHLLPDLSAAIDVDAASAPPGPVIPRAALYFRGDSIYVMRVQPNGQSVEQPVTLSAFDAAQVQIGSGLKPGDRVILADQP